MQKGKKGGSFYLTQSGNKVYANKVPDLRPKGFASKLAAKFKPRKMAPGVPDLRSKPMAHQLARGAKAVGRAGKGLASRLLSAGKQAWAAHKTKQAAHTARVLAARAAPHLAQSQAHQQRAIQLMAKGDVRGAMTAMMQAKQASFLHEAHQALRTGDVNSAMKSMLRAQTYPQRLAKRLQSSDVGGRSKKSSKNGGESKAKSEGGEKSSGGGSGAKPPPVPKKEDGVHSLGPRGGVYHEKDGRRKLVRARRANQL